MTVSVCQRYRWCVHETRICQQVQTNSIRVRVEAEGTKRRTWFVAASTANKTRVFVTFGRRQNQGLVGTRGKTPPDDVKFRAAAWVGNTSLLTRALRGGYIMPLSNSQRRSRYYKRPSEHRCFRLHTRSVGPTVVAQAIFVECSDLEAFPCEHVRRSLSDPGGVSVVLHPHFPLGHRHISGVPYDDHTPSRHGRRAR